MRDVLIDRKDAAGEAWQDVIIEPRADRALREVAPPREREARRKAFSSGQVGTRCGRDRCAASDTLRTL